MSRLLFEEKENDVKEEFKKYKWLRIMLYIYSCFLFAMFIYLLITNIISVAILVLIFFLFMLVCAIVSSIPTSQYLYIYEDKIVCKRIFREEEVFNIIPDKYFIKLRSEFRNQYNFRMIFLDSNGEIFLIYKVVTLKVSMYQTKKQKWEIDIFNIGCDIIDDTEVIKNK